MKTIFQSLGLALLILMCAPGCSDSSKGGSGTASGDETETESGETGFFPDIGTTGIESGEESGKETGDGTGTEVGEETGDDTSVESGDEVGTEVGEEEGDDAETGDEPGPGEFGYPCSENKDCLSGFCVESENGLVCTSLCLETCPDGWSCVVAQGTEGVYICVSPFSNICKPCNSDEECYPGGANNGSHCISHGGALGSFCGVTCGEDIDCPEGYVCKESELSTGVLVDECQPSSGECECNPGLIGSGVSTECILEDEDGNICTGTRECGPDGLTECDAQVPSTEICDGEDNDCDGLIDPPNTVDCTEYYLDNDADGYGIGLPECVCEAPSIKHVTQGGDCDDGKPAVNPDAEEVCNFDDDDCDGEIDEPGAQFCVEYFADLDFDNYGDEANLVCACVFGPGLETTPGDCDDGDGAIYPGAQELCDGIDNDCDGEVDEENPEGCVPFYFDSDGDGYGLDQESKCLCAPEGLYTASLVGDCDDTDPEIKPFATEVCDGVDNDCDDDGTGVGLDEGSNEELCGTVSNGVAACVEGVCTVIDCTPGYYDIDFDAVNGCECEADSIEVSGPACPDAVDVGAVADQGPTEATTLIVQGNAVYSTESDWYRFTGTDGPDGGCDTYHVRVQFLFNANDAYNFDVYRGGCAGADNDCVASTDYEWLTDFHAEQKGECPCTTVPANTNANTEECSDNTSLYYVRVFRKPGVPPSCEGYTLEITNGVY